MLKIEDTAVIGGDCNAILIAIKTEVTNKSRSPTVGTFNINEFKRAAIIAYLITGGRSCLIYHCRIMN